MNGNEGASLGAYSYYLQLHFHVAERLGGISTVLWRLNRTHIRDFGIGVTGYRKCYWLEVASHAADVGAFLRLLVPIGMTEADLMQCLGIPVGSGRDYAERQGW